MSRPNIVLIMADQLAPHFLPSYGHPVVQAPHIARLADEGVVFGAAYTNSPLCGPSRHVMMTSLLPSAIGRGTTQQSGRRRSPRSLTTSPTVGISRASRGRCTSSAPTSSTASRSASPPTSYPSDFSWHPRWDSNERQGWFHAMRTVADAGPPCSWGANGDQDVRRPWGRRTSSIGCRYRQPATTGTLSIA
ncbi:MAG: sulfatase-like hydrolase/transferase, partial [Acidimicrobiia bacterium]